MPLQTSGQWYLVLSFFGCSSQFAQVPQLGLEEVRALLEDGPGHGWSLRGAGQMGPVKLMRADESKQARPKHASSCKNSS